MRIATHKRTLQIPEVAEHSYHAYYKFYCYLQPEHWKEGTTNAAVSDTLRAMGIPCSVGSSANLWEEPVFETQKDLVRLGECANAKRLWPLQLMFVCHPTIDEGTMAKMAAVIRGVMLDFTKDESK